MSRVWDLEKIYMDAATAPSGTTSWIGSDGDGNPTVLDQANPFYGENLWMLKDYSSSLLGVLDMSGSSTAAQYVMDAEFVAVSIVEAELITSAEIDLMPLVPLKHHQSQAMIDLVAVLSEAASVWIGQVRSLTSLLNPSLCPDAYLSYLAAEIGISFDGAYDYPLIREIIKDAPTLYRYKGSNQGTKYLLNGDYMRVRDLWAASPPPDAPASYVTGSFEEGVWQIDRTGTSVPPGVTAGSYKVPHVNVYVKMVNQQTQSAVAYLLYSDEVDQLEPFQTEFEKVRPITVVPHWFLSVEGWIGNTNATVIRPGDVRSKRLSGNLSDLITTPGSATYDITNGGSAVTPGSVTPASGVIVETYPTYWIVSIILNTCATFDKIVFSYSATPVLEMTFPKVKMTNTVPVRLEVVVPNPFPS